MQCTLNPNRSFWAALMAGAFALGAAPPAALGQEFLDENLLLDVYVGSARSAIAQGLRKGGYDLAGGAYVDFRQWYTPQMPDATVLFLRPISDDFGLIWGISTGERGEKYTIDPALQLGFVYQHEPFKNGVFAIKATYPLFGRLREKTCIADYGDIGGVQEVNCRLAASILPPDETLAYLANSRADVDAKISISFTFRF
jgi:hypothetical protein